MSEPTQKGGPRKSRRGCVVLLVLAVMLTAVMVWSVVSGVAPKYAVRLGLADFLDSTVAIDRITLAPSWHGRIGPDAAPTMTIAGLRLSDRAAPDAAPPAVALGRLRLYLDIRPADGRYVDHVAIDDPTVTLVERPEGGRNFGFLWDFLMQPAETPTPAAYLPKTLRIQGASFAVERPDTAIRLSGLGAAVSIDAMDRFRLSVDDAPLHGQVRMPGLAAGEHAVEGRATVHVAHMPGKTTASADIRLPELVDLEGRFEFEGGAGENALTAALERGAAKGAVLSLIPSARMPVDLGFDGVRIERARAVASWDAASLRVPEAVLDMAADGVRIGPREAPWYTGALRFTGGGSYLDSMPAGEATLTLAQDRAIDLALVRREQRLVIEAAWEDWTRAQVFGLAPPAYRGMAKNALPAVTSLSGGAEAWYDESWQARCQLTPQLKGAAPQITFSAVHLPGAAFPLEFEGTITQGAGTAVISAGPGDDAPHVRARVDALDAAAWTRAWQPGWWPEGFGARLAGTVDVLPRADANYRFEADLTARDSRMPAVDLAPLGPLTLRGAGLFQPDMFNVAGEALAVGSEEAGFALSTTRWSFGLLNQAFEAHISGGGDVGFLSPMFGLENLGGSVDVAGRVDADSARVRVEPALTTDNLAWGDLIVPYGMALSAEGKAAYTFDDGQLAVHGLSVSLGGATRFLAEQIDAQPLVPRIDVQGLRFDTDFAPFVAMEYLLDAKGTFSLTGGTSYADGAPAADLACELSAAVLALPYTASRIVECEAQARLRYDGALDGSGTVTTQQVEVGGVAVDGLSGDLRAAESALYIEDGRGQVLGGAAELNVRIGLLEQGLPMRLRVYTHGADLAQFTEQFKPPNTTLTGTAVGEILVELREGKLADVRVDLTAKEGFSMNRDLVIQALMTQYVEGMPGGMTMREIIEGVVGEAPQREFDEARLTLGFEAGRLTGQARLESELLGLTVDILADPAAITEALRTRQRRTSSR
ncbi:MAG: hypothetical protein ACLFTT_07850 [Candidatus Hydrogenedentota bacterium]